MLCLINFCLGKEFLECLLDPDIDLARGEQFYSDDSSDDDSSTTDEEAKLGEFEWGELDKDAKWDCGEEEVEVSFISNLLRIVIINIRKGIHLFFKNTNKKFETKPQTDFF